MFTAQHHQAVCDKQRWPAARRKSTGRIRTAVWKGRRSTDSKISVWRLFQSLQEPYTANWSREDFRRAVSKPFAWSVYIYVYKYILRYHTHSTTNKHKRSPIFIIYIEPLNNIIVHRFTVLAILSDAWCLHRS